MGNIFDVPINEFILKLAEELKSIEAIKPLEWAQFCKTGVHKERPPVQRDWWYVRAASMLRAIKVKGPIGTQKLRIKYGGRKNRGYRPEHFYKGSGSIIRKILQQLEKAGFVKQDKKGVHKGRVVSSVGDKLLNKIAIVMMKELNIVIPKRPDEELKITNVVKKKKKRKVRKRKKVTRKKVKKAVKKKAPKTKTVEKPKEEAKQEAKVVPKVEKITEEKKPETQEAQEKQSSSEPQKPKASVELKKE
jgi:small subunit ribosomal protein S19e